MAVFLVNLFIGLAAARSGSGPFSKLETATVGVHLLSQACRSHGALTSPALASHGSYTARRVIRHALTRIDDRVRAPCRRRR